MYLVNKECQEEDDLEAPAIDETESLNIEVIFCPSCKFKRVSETGYVQEGTESEFSPFKLPPLDFRKTKLEGLANAVWKHLEVGWSVAWLVWLVGWLVCSFVRSFVRSFVSE